LVVEGFSEPEAGWRWTNAKHARMQFKLVPPRPSDPLRLCISFFTYPCAGRESAFFVQVNGASPIRIDTPSELAMKSQTVDVPLQVQDETLDIQLYIPNRKRPDESPYNDGRELGVAVQTCTIKTAQYN
jgi:hypothetical protein